MRAQALATPEGAAVTTAPATQPAPVYEIIYDDEPTPAELARRAGRNEQRHNDNTQRCYAWRAATHDLTVALANGTPASRLAELATAREKASQAFFTPNFPWAYKMAQRFTGRSATLDQDYRQAAVLGLIEAGTNWEPAKSTFPTYARPFIQGELLNAIRLAEHSLLPKDDFDKRRQVTAAIDEHMAQFHTTPSNQQVAAATGLRVDQIHRVRTAYVVGIDTAIGGDNPFVADTAVTAGNPNCSVTEETVIPDGLTSDQYSQLVSAALEQLPAREAMALTLSLGLGGTPKLTLAEIGPLMATGREPARRLLNRATERITPVITDLMTQADAYAAS